MTAAPAFPPDPDRCRRAESGFLALHERLIAAFEAIEDEFAEDSPPAAPARFARRDWQRTGGGGGTTAILKGRVFEKAGVNVSTVFGEFSPEFRARIPGAAEDPRFWASGVSLVAHPSSPLVPAVHLNTRHIITTRAWFGGGADLTPIYPDEDAARDFHAALAAACAGYERGAYARFKTWCDDYFFLPHRGEPRGAGGIFFDDLDSGDWERDFAFVQGVGAAFLAAYPAIVRARMRLPWSEAQRRHQLMRRGRYVEFNLIHDRGTLFGLKTGGDVEAILMSLPPLAAWP